MSATNHPHLGIMALSVPSLLSDPRRVGWGKRQGGDRMQAGMVGLGKWSLVFDSRDQKTSQGGGTEDQGTLYPAGAQSMCPDAPKRP